MARSTAGVSDSGGFSLLGLSLRSQASDSADSRNRYWILTQHVAAYFGRSLQTWPAAMQSVPKEMRGDECATLGTLRVVVGSGGQSKGKHGGTSGVQRVGKC